MQSRSVGKIVTTKNKNKLNASADVMTLLAENTKPQKKKRKKRK